MRRELQATVGAVKHVRCLVSVQLDWSQLRRMLHLKVMGEPALSGEGSSTKETGIGLLATVCDKVHIEGGLLGKFALAMRARKRFITCVCSEVIVKGELLSKLALAMRAAIRFFTGVGSEVFVKGELLGKLLLAMVTD